MAKRIEFIAPVEAMRGNLSGRQNLLYAENDNKAYEGPVGSVNYARNYTTRFIGAKRASDGRKYFSVRTKSANHLTAAAKRAMALLGGTGAIVAAILRNKTGEPYSQAYAQWLELQNLGNNKTFRETLSGWIRSALVAKSATIPFTGPRAVYSIKNPFMNATQTTGAVIGTDIVVKFWTELGASGAVTFTIDGAIGVTLTGYSFADIIDGTIEENGNVPNVLNLSRVVGSPAYVQYNGMYIKGLNQEAEEVYAEDSMAPNELSAMRTTTDTPS